MNKRILCVEKDWKFRPKLFSSKHSAQLEHSSLKGLSRRRRSVMMFGAFLRHFVRTCAPRGAQLRAFVIRDGLMRTTRGRDHLRVNRCLWLWHLTADDDRASAYFTPPARRYITSGVAWRGIAPPLLFIVAPCATSR